MNTLSYPLLDASQRAAYHELLNKYNEAWESSASAAAIVDEMARVPAARSVPGSTGSMSDIAKRWRKNRRRAALIAYVNSLKELYACEVIDWLSFPGYESHD